MTADRLVAVTVFVAIGLMLSYVRGRRGLFVALAGVAVACGSYLTSLRTIHPEDDVLNYFDLYLALGAGDWSGVASLGGGVEVVVPVALRLMHAVLGPMPLQAFIFWLTFVGVAAATMVYERLARLVRDDRDSALSLSFAIAYVSFFTASHTSRQFAADIAMLPLLATQLRRRPGIFVAAAAVMSHVTSLLYIGAMWMCRTRVRLLMFLVAVALVVANASRLLLLGLDVVPEGVLQKLTLLTLADAADGDVSNVPDVVRLGLLAGVVAIGQRLSPDAVPVWTRRFVYLGVVVGLLLVNVPFVGGRANHLLLQVAYGFVLFMSIRWSRRVARFAVMAGLAYQARLLLSY